jgi:competence protein ComEC
MYQTLHQTPFLRFLLPFILGIVFQYYLEQQWLMVCSFALSIVFLILHLTGRDSYVNRWFFGIFVSLFCFGGGMFGMGQSLQKITWTQGEEAIYSSGILMDYPSEKAKTMMCKLQLLSVDRKAVDKKVIVYLPKDSASLSLLPGDCVTLHCHFMALKKSAGTHDFDYAGYMQHQGYAATGFVGKNQWHRTAHTSTFKYTALQCRTYLIDLMKTFKLSPETFALNVAMSFGYKALMDDDVSQSFRAAGIAHLVAISGLHVQIIFLMLYKIFAFLGNSRRDKIIRSLIILPIIWIFTFVTGLAPSLLRATLMISFYALGELLARKPSVLNMIYVSAMAMLLVDPLYLFDIGFQLSYAAVLSIVIIYPMLHALRETPNPLLRYCRELLCISLAAQLGTTPLCIYYFHQFPVYFWIANLFIVPLSSPLLMGTLSSVGIQSLVALPSWVYCPLEWILQAMIWMAKSVEALPFSVVGDFYPDEIETGLIYAILLAAILFIQNKKIRHIYPLQ